MADGIFFCNICDAAMERDKKKIWCAKCGNYHEIDWILDMAEKIKTLGIETESQLTDKLIGVDNENKEH